MGHNKSRAKQRAIEEKAKYSSALALVESLSPALHAEVKANSIQIQVVPYHSREDLEAKGFVVNGSHFADFDSFRVDGNPSFIRPDLIFDQPTICVSCAETSPGSGQFDATLELVYWPNLTEFAQKKHFDTLHFIKLVSRPLPESQYRHRQGNMLTILLFLHTEFIRMLTGCMFGWGYRRERLRGVIGRYSTKRAFAAGGVGGFVENWELNMEEVSKDHHNFFTK